jgi:DNA invertase Pin-like site-specific DNA recombinase
MAVQDKKPVAYSYVRFSSAQQALGDSLRRQVDEAEKYCRENGLELHPVSF